MLASEIRRGYEALAVLLKKRPKLLRETRAKPSWGAGGKDGKGSKADTLGGAFYHVAIDCPGYGRSAGSAKTIRSQPRKLLLDLFRSLAKSHAFMLVGASQV